MKKINGLRLFAVLVVLFSAGASGCGNKPERLSGVFVYSRPDDLRELNEWLAQRSGRSVQANHTSFNSYDFRTDGSVVLKSDLLKYPPGSFYEKKGEKVAVFEVLRISQIAGIWITNYDTNIFRVEGNDLILQSVNDSKDPQKHHVGERFIRQ